MSAVTVNNDKKYELHVKAEAGLCKWWHGDSSQWCSDHVATPWRMECVLQPPSWYIYVFYVGFSNYWNMWPIVQNRFGAGQWIFYNVGNCFRVDNNSVVLHNLRDYCQPCKVMYMWRAELEEIYLCSFFPNSCLLSFKNIAVITNWQTARCTSSRPAGRLMLLPVPLKRTIFL